MTKKHVALIVIAIVASASAAGIGYKLDNRNHAADSLRTPDSSSSSSSTESIVVDGPAVQTGQTITIEGTYDCLTPANTSGPQTMECALGMKTDNGIQYGLSDPDHSKLMGMPTGQRIRATGTLTPTQSTKYPISGTITVTTLDYNTETPN